MIYKFKTCKDCLKEKPISQFYRRKDTPDKRTYCCMECENKRSVAWQASHKDHVSTWRLEWRRKSPRQSLNVSLNGALRRCPTENPATIGDVFDLWKMQNGRCALTGLTMTWAQGKVLPTSITLDRIIPEKGYTIKNIRLICHAVNSFRGRMSDADMIDMARAIIAHAEKRELQIA